MTAALIVGAPWPAPPSARCSAAMVISVSRGAILAALDAGVALAIRRIDPSTARTYGPFLVAGALVVLFAAPDGPRFG